MRAVSKKQRVKTELRALAGRLGRGPTADELRRALDAAGLSVSRTTIWRLLGGVGAMAPESEVKVKQSDAHGESRLAFPAAGSRPVARPRGFASSSVYARVNRGKV